MKKQDSLWKGIDKILWEDWDPIGLCGSGPDDEYRTYVPSILKLLLNGSDEKAIAKLLLEHANVNMGLTTELCDHLAVAKKLRALL